MYGPEHLCTPTFRLYSDGDTEVFYAPFDSVNMSAKVAVVQITPGFQQMEIAFRSARAALVNGETGVEACRQAKAQASFAGPMRRNLISMLAVGRAGGSPNGLGILAFAWVVLDHKNDRNPLCSAASKGGITERLRRSL